MGVQALSGLKNKPTAFELMKGKYSPGGEPLHYPSWLGDHSAEGGNPLRLMDGFGIAGQFAVAAAASISVQKPWLKGETECSPTANPTSAQYLPGYPWKRVLSRASAVGGGASAGEEEYYSTLGYTKRDSRVQEHPAGPAGVFEGCSGVHRRRPNSRLRDCVRRSMDGLGAEMYAKDSSPCTCDRFAKKRTLRNAPGARMWGGDWQDPERLARQVSIDFEGDVLGAGPEPFFGSLPPARRFCADGDWAAGTETCGELSPDAAGKNYAKVNAGFCALSRLDVAQVITGLKASTPSFLWRQDTQGGLLPSDVGAPQKLQVSKFLGHVATTEWTESGPGKTAYIDCTAVYRECNNLLPGGMRRVFSTYRPSTFYNDLRPWGGGQNIYNTEVRVLNASSGAWEVSAAPTRGDVFEDPTPRPGSLPRAAGSEYRNDDYSQLYPFVDSGFSASGSVETLKNNEWTSTGYATDGSPNLQFMSHPGWREIESTGKLGAAEWGASSEAYYTSPKDLPKFVPHVFSAAAMDASELFPGLHCSGVPFSAGYGCECNSSNVFPYQTKSSNTLADHLDAEFSQPSTVCGWQPSDGLRANKSHFVQQHPQVVQRQVLIAMFASESGQEDSGWDMSLPHSRASKRSPAGGFLAADTLFRRRYYPEGELDHQSVGDQRDGVERLLMGLKGSVETVRAACGWENRDMDEANGCSYLSKTHGDDTGNTQRWFLRQEAYTAESTTAVGVMEFFHADSYAPSTPVRDSLDPGGREDLLKAMQAWAKGMGTDLANDVPKIARSFCNDYVEALAEGGNKALFDRFCRPRPPYYTDAMLSLLGAKDFYMGYSTSGVLQGLGHDGLFSTRNVDTFTQDQLALLQPLPRREVRLPSVRACVNSYPDECLPAKPGLHKPQSRQMTRLQAGVRNVRGGTFRSGGVYDEKAVADDIVQTGRALGVLFGKDDCMDIVDAACDKDSPLGQYLAARGRGLEWYTLPTAAEAKSLVEQSFSDAEKRHRGAGMLGGMCDGEVDCPRPEESWTESKTCTAKNVWMRLLERDGAPRVAGVVAPAGERVVDKWWNMTADCRVDPAVMRAGENTSSGVHGAEARLAGCPRSMVYHDRLNPVTLEQCVKPLMQVPNPNPIVRSVVDNPTSNAKAEAFDGGSFFSREFQRKVYGPGLHHGNLLALRELFSQAAVAGFDSSAPTDGGTIVTEGDAVPMHLLVENLPVDKWYRVTLYVTWDKCMEAPWHSEDQNNLFTDDTDSTESENPRMRLSWDRKLHVQVYMGKVKKVHDVFVQGWCVPSPLFCSFCSFFLGGGSVCLFGCVCVCACVIPVFFWVCVCVDQVCDAGRGGGAKPHEREGRAAGALPARVHGQGAGGPRLRTQQRFAGGAYGERAVPVL